MFPSLPLLCCESSVSVKENPDRNKNQIGQKILKIVIYKMIYCCLKMINFLLKQKCVTLIFSENFGSTSPKFNAIREWHNSIIKKFVFHQSIKPINKKFKIKSEFSIHHVSKDTIKRIIDDLDIKKPSSGEIQTFFFKVFL